ncbi:MAG: HNH endonuclease [Gemmatimonadetes bacterium]|nr:HNH endonuclease [Gemmatimonadota bacterium]
MGFASPADSHAHDETESGTDVDTLENLGDEIATLAAHIHAATARLLALIARFDRWRGWEPAGHRSCAHWLAYRAGLDLGTAREHVRVARALEDLPLSSAAMARGELSFSQARALTRVAKRSTEEDLLELAVGCTTAQLERLVHAWKRGSRRDEADIERERHLSRTFSVFPDDEGMYVVQGLLEPETGAVLMRAVEAAGDALFRRDGVQDPAADTSREAARRRADAIGIVAERSLVGGRGDRSDANEAARATSGTRADRYQVVLYVDQETLSESGEPGRSELEDGTRVSAETSRRLSCDASVVRISGDLAGDGRSRDAGRSPDAEQTPDARNRKGTGSTRAAGNTKAPPVREHRIRPALSVGRRTRTISPALRRALAARDRGCRFPGCGLRFTEAHHVVHWADGGETSLANTVLLCRFHHRLVHEGEWNIEWMGPSKVAFVDPEGTMHCSGAPRTRPGVGDRPVDVIARRNRLCGADPNAWTSSARWRRETHIPDDVLFRAMEAAL